MGILWHAPKPKPIRYSIKEVSASRAIYEGPRVIPSVDFTFVTDDGTVIEFSLDHMQTATLIEHTMTAYNAIFPPLRTSRGGWGL